MSDTILHKIPYDENQNRLSFYTDSDTVIMENGDTLTLRLERLESSINSKPGVTAEGSLSSGTVEYINDAILEKFTEAVRDALEAIAQALESLEQHSNNVTTSLNALQGIKDNIDAAIQTANNNAAQAENIINGVKDVVKEVLDDPETFGYFVGQDTGDELNFSKFIQSCNEVNSFVGERTRSGDTLDSYIDTEFSQKAEEISMSAAKYIYEPYEGNDPSILNKLHQTIELDPALNYYYVYSPKEAVVTLNGEPLESKEGNITGVEFAVFEGNSLTSFDLYKTLNSSYGNFSVEPDLIRAVLEKKDDDEGPTFLALLVIDDEGIRNLVHSDVTDATKDLINSYDAALAATYNSIIGEVGESIYKKLGNSVTLTKETPTYTWDLTKFEDIDSVLILGGPGKIKYSISDKKGLPDSEGDWGNYENAPNFKLTLTLEENDHYLSVKLKKDSKGEYVTDEVTLQLITVPFTTKLASLEIKADSITEQISDLDPEGKGLVTAVLTLTASLFDSMITNGKEFTDFRQRLGSLEATVGNGEGFTNLEQTVGKIALTAVGGASANLFTGLLDATGWQLKDYQSFDIKTELENAPSTASFSVDSSSTISGSFPSGGSTSTGGFNSGINIGTSTNSGLLQTVEIPDSAATTKPTVLKYDANGNLMYYIAVVTNDSPEKNPENSEIKGGLQIVMPGAKADSNTLLLSPIVHLKKDLYYVLSWNGATEKCLLGIGFTSDTSLENWTPLIARKSETSLGNPWKTNTAIVAKAEWSKENKMSYITGTWNVVFKVPEEAFVKFGFAVNLKKTYHPDNSSQIYQYVNFINLKLELGLLGENSYATEWTPSLFDLKNSASLSVTNNQILALVQNRLDGISSEIRQTAEDVQINIKNENGEVINGLEVNEKESIFKGSVQAKELQIYNPSVQADSRIWIAFYTEDLARLYQFPKEYIHEETVEGNTTTVGTIPYGTPIIMASNGSKLFILNLTELPQQPSLPQYYWCAIKPKWIEVRYLAKLTQRLEGKCYFLPKQTFYIKSIVGTGSNKEVHESLIGANNVYCKNNSGNVIVYDSDGNLWSHLYTASDEEVIEIKGTLLNPLKLESAKIESYSLVENGTRYFVEKDFNFYIGSLPSDKPDIINGLVVVPTEMKDGIQIYSDRQKLKIVSEGTEYKIDPLSFFLAKTTYNQLEGNAPNDAFKAYFFRTILEGKGETLTLSDVEAYEAMAYYYFYGRKKAGKEILQAEKPGLS